MLSVPAVNMIQHDLHYFFLCHTDTSIRGDVQRRCGQQRDAHYGKRHVGYFAEPCGEYRYFRYGEYNGHDLDYDHLSD